MESNEVKPEKQSLVAETLTNIQAASLYSVAVWGLAIIAGLIAFFGSVLPIWGVAVSDQAWTVCQMALLGLVSLLGGKAATS